MKLSPEQLAKNRRTVRVGDPDAYPLDQEMQDILREESAPLQEVFPEEFQRYTDLFFKYFPKRPVHVRTSYGGGFVCQLGVKKDATKYERPCYPDMLARMLDLAGR